MTIPQVLLLRTVMNGDCALLNRRRHARFGTCSKWTLGLRAMVEATRWAAFCRRWFPL